MQIFFKQTMSHGFTVAHNICEVKEITAQWTLSFPTNSLFFLPQVIKKNNNDFYLMFIFAIYGTYEKYYLNKRSEGTCENECNWVSIIRKELLAALLAKICTNQTKVPTNFDLHLFGNCHKAFFIIEIDQFFILVL